MASPTPTPPPPPPPPYNPANSAFAAVYPKDTKNMPPPPPVDPRTHLPTTFRVGREYVTPVVTIPQLVDHLMFLSCLHRLQEDVRDAADDSDDDVSGDIKWAAFCTRAGLRFEEWATSQPLLDLADQLLVSGRELVNPAEDTVLQPDQVAQAIAGVDIDVLMAWHTYMLNPRIYAEDLDREGNESGRLRGLKALGVFPMALVAARIDPVSYVYQPFQDGAGAAAAPPAYTSHALDLVDISANESTVAITCPQCLHHLTIPLLGPPIEGCGYLSPAMAIPCSHCQLEVSHEKLHVARMFRDLAEIESGRVTYLPGMGKDPNTGMTPRVGALVSDALVKGVLATTNRTWIDVPALCQEVGWSLERARRMIISDTVRAKGLVRVIAALSTVMSVKHIVSAALNRYARVYAEGSDGVATIDLGAAIMRQASFVGSMEGIGWLDTARWTDDQDPNRYFLLQKAAARYHAFLDLLATHRSAFLSPTLDIDLAWHTHQLTGHKYGSFTEKVVKRFIDHDDKVADVTLKNAFDKTATLWAERFHTSYSGCGCPVSHDATRELDRATRSEAPSGLKFWKRKERAASIAGAQANIEQLKGSTHAERGASCPSTHNRVRVQGSGALDRRRKLVWKGTPDVSAAHPDPFLTYYEFRPRKVRTPGRRRRDSRPSSRNSNSNNRNRTAAAADPYWGVSPYMAYGPYGLMNPWCLGIGAGEGAGVGAGVGIAATAACCTGAGGACGAAGACAASVGFSACGAGASFGGAAMCGVGGSACGGGGGNCGGGGGGCGGGGC